MATSGTSVDAPKTAAPAVTLVPDTSPEAPPGGGNLIRNSTFEDETSLPWASSFSPPADGKATVEKGAYCLQINHKGENAFDAQIRQRELLLQKDHAYSISFRAFASADTKALPKVKMSGPPYDEYWAAVIALTAAPQHFKGHFTMKGADEPAAELAFQLGGSAAGPKGPFKVCIDDVKIEDPQYTPPAIVKVPPPPKVRVNEVGYFNGLEKHAIVNSASTTPLPWELDFGDGAPVAKGVTLVFKGEDVASGEPVHVIDFTSLNKPGTKYKIKVGSDESPTFAIGRDIYKKLKYDALAYFYHNRSGIAITLPYAGEKKYTHGAGHVSDKSVPCLVGSGCAYSLDVSGGWYDAGDHGKYVVNGGISVWTLLNEYERSKFLGSSSGDFGDGKMNIPENKNGVPDLLDEVRWELEFEMRMQVPAGNPRAGMVHHKVHDEKWTPLGTAPDEDTVKRFLHAPSTAATLNLAANAAQAARIWKTIDPAFSARCLASAERAWAAAQANPATLASGGANAGGGEYGDRNLGDEFYWAAAELLLTTGKPVYKDFVTKSPVFNVLKSPRTGAISSMKWSDTQALGTISLAIVPGALDAALVSASRASVVSAADAYLEVMAKEGYRVPLKPDTATRYVWGSNADLLNNLIILALANDFTGNVKYLNGVAEGMDYLLGRNPLSQSYITGYGSRPLQNPHHRFWAHQENEKFPSPPPGVVSGGPNSGLEDPYVKAAGLSGCAPQKCFMDHIEAWSTNEVAINWNASLAWVAAYLDEKGK